MTRARAATIVAIFAGFGCKGESARRDDAAGLRAGADATVTALRARPQSPLGASIATGFDAVSNGFAPRFAAAAGRVSARAVLPARASGAIHLEDAASGASAEVSLDGARDVAAQASGGFLVYANAHSSGATLLHRPIPTGAEDFISFDAPPAASEISYRLKLGERVAGLRLVAGVLEMLDAAGAPRLRVDPPYIVGADGARADAVLAVTGCAVDRNPAAPWGRPVTAPGAKTCTVRVGWRGAEVAYPAVLDPRWTTTGNMVAARTDHTAIALSTGKVLVACGRASTTSTTGLATAELFDPTSGTWATTGNLTGTTPGRWSHSATQLNTGSNTTTSGKVLIAGGINGTASVNTAQLYDTGAGTWATAGNLNVARHLHTATLLPNGNVLVAGGMTATTVAGMTTTTVLSSAAIYNPGSNSGSWTAVGTNMTTARRFHSATLLPASSNMVFSNKVLIVGGNSGGTTSVATVQLFNPTTSTWSTTTALPAAREGQTATKLANGNVLITGGRTGAGAPLASTLVLTIPTSGAGTWASAGSMTVARVAHTATLLPAGVVANGQVLVAGGSTDGTNPITGADVWNGMTTWTATTSVLSTAVQAHTTTSLAGGAVLVAGGNSGTSAVNAAQLFDPFFCTANSDCASGFCVSGVCCNTACANECSACNLTGSVGTCSPKANGTACTDDGNACTTDTCNGSGTCQHPAGNMGAPCRNAAGVCDVGATCTGSSTTCPANPFKPSSIVCRPAASGGCDVDENCTGSSAACPADQFKMNGTPCPDDGNVCTTDLCSGTSATCVHAPGNLGTPCRNAAGDCDQAATCTGSSTTCPANPFKPSTTVCRAAASGGCDVDENCTGSSAACPADQFKAMNTACADDGNVCTTDLCSGSSATCVHAPGNLGTPCRTAAGDCDVAATCTGSSTTCPANAFKPSTTVCRAAASGGCDVAESCTGSSAACPPDQFAPSSTVCRASAGQCDVAETCTGTSASCPADAVASNGTACNDANFCTLGDTCHAGACVGGSANPACHLPPALTPAQIAAAKGAGLLPGTYLTPTRFDTIGSAPNNWAPVAVAVNDSGVVAGFTHGSLADYPIGSTGYPFTADTNGARQLPIPWQGPAATAYAVDIDDSGFIAGEGGPVSYPTGFDFLHPIVYQPGGATYQLPWVSTIPGMQVYAMNNTIGSAGLPEVVGVAVAFAGSGPSAGTLDVWHFDNDGNDALGPSALVPPGGVAWVAGHTSAPGHTFVSGDAAISLDGNECLSTSSMVSLGDNTIAGGVNSAAGLTALAWVKPDAATCPGTRAIASRGSEFSIWLDCKPDSSAATLRAFAHTTTGDHWTTGVGTIPFGQWSHVVVTWDKARARSFVNGALVGDEAFGGLVPPTSSWVSVGCWPPNPVNNFKGAIDEVSMFQNGMGADEIALHVRDVTNYNRSAAWGRIQDGFFNIIEAPPGPLFTGSGLALRVNDAGVAVGYQNLTSGLTAAFMFDPAKGWKNLNDLLGPDTGWDLQVANGIDQKSRFVVGDGLYYGRSLPFQLDLLTGQLTDLGLPAGFPADPAALGVAYAHGRSINASGHVVGDVGIYNITEDHGFIYTEATGVVDLNDFVDPAAGWIIADTLDINDNDEVVGWARHPNADGSNTFSAFKMKVPLLPSIGTVSCIGQPDGTACDDLDACTTGETCHGGICGRGTAVVCPGGDQCHDACDPTAGCHAPVAMPNGTACNDGNACTQTDSCQAGVCTGSAPVVCAQPDQCHDVGACDPATGQCSNPVKLDQAAGPFWTSKAAMATPRYEPASVALGGLSYVFGGCTAPPCGPASTATVEAYDPTQNAWSPRAPMPTARSTAAAATLGGTVYVVGGYGPGDTLLGKVTVEAYDPVHDSWMTKASMNVGRTAPAVGAIGGKLYVFGGHCCNDNTTIPPDFVDSYDPATDTWTARGPVPTQRFDGAYGVIGGKIYVAGGLAPDRTLIDTLEVYDPATDSWTSRKRMPSALEGPGAAVVDGKLYVLGGSTASSSLALTVFNQVYIYDPASDSWSVGPAMTSARYGAAATVNGETILLAGGYTGTTPTNVVDALASLRGPSCDDGSACTRADSCQAGTCTGTNPVVCAAPDQCHVGGTCNPADGTCSLSRAPDGIACSDGNRCTAGDSCQAGTCLPGPTNVCTGQGQTPYASVIDLGSTQGLSYAISINNNGDVVGADVPSAAGVYQTGEPGSRAYRWSPSEGMVYLPGSPTISYADAINDAGVISMSTGTTRGVMFPCRFDRAVDTQPACQTSPGFSTGINAAGTVTGWIAQSTVLRAFRLGAGPIEIPTLDPNSPDQRGAWIDSDGTIVGTQLGVGAIRISARGTEVLADLLPAASDPWDLTSPAFIRSGEIIGWGHHGGHARAFRIKTNPNGDVASIAELPMPAPPSPFASPDAPNLMAADSENAAGEIVGTIWDSGASFPQDAFVYTDAHGTVDLNTLIDPQSGWTLLSAWSINDHHEVVGIGNHDGASHAYKLTLPDLSTCPTDACHIAVRDPVTGTCSSTPKPNGSACDDGNACTQGDVCTAGSCQGATAFACVAPNTCQDTGTCNPGAPSAGPPSTQDLIGWWRLDGDGRDASGGGHDLTIEGNVTPVPGRVGLGMQFDGTSCMTTPIWPEARMQGANGVTMMAWVNPSASIVCPGGQTAEAVMGRSYDYSLGSWCYPTPGIAATGTVRTAGAQTWGYPGGLGLLTPNQWTHVAVTWDHNQITIYINGNANGLSVISYPDPGAFGDVDSTFAIGCLISYYFTLDQRIWNFKGSIDEAMLYRRVLSPAEILAYYTTADPCTHPVHADGSSCTDFNLCTQTDTCHAGACVGTNPVVCTADQCHDAGTCVSYLGTCTGGTPKADGTSCNDGNACTRTDVCEAGACVGANPTVCLAQDSCHTATCDQATGQCTSAANGGTCDLGAFDYDKAGRLIRDRGAELHYDAYDQLREVLPTASPPAFTNLAVDDLWTPGDGETQALAGHSNSKGHVPVEVSLAAGGYRTLLFEGNGTPLDLTAAAGMGTSVFGNSMNDADAVAGSWTPTAGGSSHAFRYDQTGFHDLGNPGDSTFAFDINNQNQVSGYFLVGANAHGYRHSDASPFQEIGTLGGAQSWAWRVDDLGIVSASAQTPDSPSTGFARFGHAALYHDFIGLQDLSVAYADPMSGTTLAIANEKQGDYVVGIATTTGIPQRAYRLKLSTGALDDIGWAGSSFGYSVNSAGDAVGWGYTDAAETIQAAWILSDRTGFAKLNDLIDPASGWDLRTASSIDDSGDVVGWGYHNGRVSAYRLRIPAHSSGTGGPTVAEVHTYGYDGLRTSTTTAPGTTSSNTQVWFTQDYSEHDGKREHYVRIGNRIVAKVTLQPPMAGSGGGSTGVLIDPRHPPVDLGDLVAKILLALLIAAGLATTAAGLVGKKRRPAWVAATAGPVVLLFLGSCDKLNTNRRSAETVWQRIKIVYFHHGIGAGPALTTNDDGTLNEERRYEPFGQPIDANVGGTLGPVDFRREQQNSLGKLTNPNTGWSYQGARWMQPQSARWTAPDPAVKIAPQRLASRPWELNPYAFVNWNPVMLWDPDGQSPKLIIVTDLPPSQLSSIQLKIITDRVQKGMNLLDPHTSVTIASPTEMRHPPRERDEYSVVLLNDPVGTPLATQRTLQMLTERLEDPGVAQGVLNRLQAHVLGNTPVTDPGIHESYINLQEFRNAQPASDSDFQLHTAIANSMLHEVGHQIMQTARTALGLLGLTTTNGSTHFGSGLMQQGYKHDPNLDWGPADQAVRSEVESNNESFETEAAPDPRAF